MTGSTIGAVVTNWGDGAYTFDIQRLAQVRELEEKLNLGLYEIYDRIEKGTWRTPCLSEVIRLGLIGGGVPPAMALTLVDRYVHQRPWTENLALVRAILLAALLGGASESVGNAVAEAGEVAASPSRKSTEPAPPSA